jgi:hypothetical protein
VCGKWLQEVLTWRRSLINIGVSGMQGQRTTQTLVSLTKFSHYIHAGVPFFSLFFVLFGIVH